MPEPETSVRILYPTVQDVVDVETDLAAAVEVSAISPETADIVAVRLGQGVALIGPLAHLVEFAATLSARLIRIAEARSKVAPFDRSLPLGVAADDDIVTTDGPS